MSDTSTGPERFVAAIVNSSLTIYDAIEVGHPTLWIPSPELQELLHRGLAGISLAGLPLRTRSRVVKEHVCRILGYPVPPAFKRTQPRFPGQLFDVYVQKSNNLQIWNEQLAPSRRYVLIRVANNDVIVRVKVVTGDALAKLDTTGRLTQKYQARCMPGSEKAELIADLDSELLRPFVCAQTNLRVVAKPIDHPRAGELLPIATIFKRLKSLVNRTFDDAGFDQERNRGAALHHLVCQALGYAGYQDDGQFPDIRHQLLEIKLQTSPTIDLGLVKPNSSEALDVPQINGCTIRHCDVRYAIFYARTNGRRVSLTHLFLTTGESFFSRFVQFQGRVLNQKLQIPLPTSFFAG